MRRLGWFVGVATLVVACSSSNPQTADGGPATTSDAAIIDASPTDAIAPPLHGPIQGLVKFGTAEYVTGMLMDDGSIEIASGQVTPVLNKITNAKFVDFAGGLHQVVAADSTGHVWTWGDSANGLQGSGASGGDASQPYEILTDANGDDFTNVVQVAGGLTASGAVKSDGTVWVWGDCIAGILGDGTQGGATLRPTQVPLPVKIKKLVFSDIVTALATDGSIWTWGSDGAYNIDDLLGRTTTSGLTAGKVENLPSNIADIASGQSFSYALTTDNKLYGWGVDTRKLGLQTWSPMMATDMSTIIELQAPVQFVSANDHTTHVILTDGTLWGWGDDAMGEVGDGHEIDWGEVTEHSNGLYAWDWGVDDMPVYTPVQIAANAGKFKAVYTNTSYVFYMFAVTEDGHVYSWGRNKTGDLMNGIVAAAPLYGNISATYPNSWDVTSPVSVNPFEVTKNVEVTSPYCIANPTIAPCNQFDNQTGKATYEN
jgi:alpha-tubulin suppressor-like RCC1 family protein